MGQGRYMRDCGKAFLLALLLFLPDQSRAEDLPAALGRISYGRIPKPGGAICSGVLVAPDLVLTAGHCARGSAADPGGLRFEVDWRSGRPADQRRGAEVILAGPGKTRGLAGLPEDLALIRLDHPLAPELVLPFFDTDPDQPGDTFRLFAFRRDAPDRPEPGRDCHLLGQSESLLALDCPVVSGNSGAPVLSRDQEGWRLEAVMVASSRPGVIRAWAVRPQPFLTAWLRR